ncbi:MAG: hypothetical protein ACYCU7_01990 [Acidimicrobiales bacterium]
MHRDGRLHGGLSEIEAVGAPEEVVTAEPAFAGLRQELDAAVEMLAACWDGGGTA